MLIREVIKDDLLPLLELYTQLHGNDMPKTNTALESLWNGILAEKNHHIIIGVRDHKLISSCVLVVVPNLVHAPDKSSGRRLQEIEIIYNYIGTFDHSKVT